MACGRARLSYQPPRRLKQENLMSRLGLDRKTGAGREEGNKHFLLHLCLLDYTASFPRLWLYTPVRQSVHTQTHTCAHMALRAQLMDHVHPVDY